MFSGGRNFWACGLSHAPAALPPLRVAPGQGPAGRAPSARGRGFGAERRSHRDLEPGRPGRQALRPRRGSDSPSRADRGLGPAAPQTGRPCPVGARPGRGVDSCRGPVPSAPRRPLPGRSRKGRRCSPEPGLEAAGAGPPQKAAGRGHSAAAQHSRRHLAPAPRLPPPGPPLTPPPPPPRPLPRPGQPRRGRGRAGRTRYRCSAGRGRQGERGPRRSRPQCVPALRSRSCEPRERDPGEKPILRP